MDPVVNAAPTIDGPLIWSPDLDGAVVQSMRGEDFECAQRGRGNHLCGRPEIILSADLRPMWHPTRRNPSIAGHGLKRLYLPRDKA